MRRRIMLGLGLLLAMVLAPPGLDAQGVTRFTGGLKADSISADIILPFAVTGTLSDSLVLVFEAPWDLAIEQVSARAGAITNPGDGDVTIDVLVDDTLSVLSSAFSIATADSVYKQAGLTTVASQGSTVTLLFGLNGTSPAIGAVVVAITGRRRLPDP